MINAQSEPEVPLIASPYDLRVALSANVPETDIRAALESGEVAKKIETVISAGKKT